MQTTQTNTKSLWVPLSQAESNLQIRTDFLVINTVSRETLLLVSHPIFSITHVWMPWKLRASVPADIREGRYFRLRISVAEVLSDVRSIHSGKKYRFSVAPEQQPGHVTCFVHLNSKKWHMSLPSGSFVSCCVIHRCFSPFATTAALTSQFKGCPGMRRYGQLKLKNICSRH